MTPTDLVTSIVCELDHVHAHTPARVRMLLELALEQNEAGGDVRDLCQDDRLSRFRRRVYRDFALHVMRRARSLPSAPPEDLGL